MSWTNVPKPNTQTYTNVNPQGKENYDKSDITYDSSTTYYDGVNPSQWIDINKPTTVYTWANTGSTWVNFNHQWQSPTWTLVNKPT